nr:dehydrodolichyl diphosphate synthase complex subunit NUS1 isoform X3 [Ziziphus jujuba var. spinosa]
MKCSLERKPSHSKDKWSLGMKCRGLTVALLKLVQIGNLVLLLLWHILHFIVSIFYFVLGIARVAESYFISSGFLKKYKSLNLGKLRCLAIVIESEEAYQTLQVIELLQWLGAIGVKSVCLYDKEGVTKKSKQAILGKLNNAVIFEVLSSICCPKESSENDKLVDHNHMMLEFASFSDGKEAVTKAANLLFMKYLKLNKLAGDQEGQIFTEPHMAEALKAIGCKGADPDLLLVYGPARCHLGFPIWRIRYTEIVHMGPLKSMRYGSLIKAIYKFTMVRQNYGK